MKIHNSTYEERLSSTVTLCVLYVPAIVSCGLVVFLTFYAHLYKTRVNLLLANVALAEFLLNFSNLILQPPNIMSDTKWFICDWCGYITFVTGLEACWFVPVVVMNRYISIFHSTAFKTIYTTRNIILMIIVGWLVLILVITPFHVGGVTGFEYQYENCGLNTTDAHVVWEILVYVLVVGPTLVANGVTSYCNLRIFLRLRAHAKSGDKIMKNNVIAQNKQLMYVTLLYSLYAVCLQSPYVLGMLFPKIIEGNVLRQIFPFLYIFNGTINPLTTLYVVKPYRNALKNLLARRKNEVEPKNTSGS